MTAPTITVPRTVSRRWKTGLVIGNVELSELITADPSDGMPSDGQRCQTIPPGSPAILQALTGQFLDSMNALAVADSAAPVTRADVKIEVWRDGYDLPAFSSQARYAAWTFLAASPAPAHSESGCLAVADPRAGSALTAMPGLPWGRQFLVRPVPGAHAVVPGWLTCSVVPLEPGQHIAVAVAASAD